MNVRMSLLLFDNYPIISYCVHPHVIMAPNEKMTINYILNGDTTKKKLLLSLNRFRKENLILSEPTGAYAYFGNCYLLYIPKPEGELRKLAVRGSNGRPGRVGVEGG